MGSDYYRVRVSLGRGDKNVLRFIVAMAAQLYE